MTAATAKASRRSRPKTRRTKQVGSVTGLAPRQRTNGRDGRLLKTELARIAYRDPLRFQVIDPGAMVCSEAVDGPSVADLEWGEQQGPVAEAALKAGFHLAVECPAGFVAQGASAVARSLSLPEVYMVYDADNERLIVWHCRDDQAEA